MPKSPRAPSQLMELFFHVMEELGLKSDREIAAVVGITPENVANWRGGSVQELKSQTLDLVRSAIATRLRALRDEARAWDTDPRAGISQLEIEHGSSPSDLQRQFQEQVGYDYLGHRFLYYEPQGALAWEKLIRDGYEQDCWMSAVEKSAAAWLDPTKDGQGDCKGPIAQLLAQARTRVRGLDFIGLGTGEGTKEAAILRRLTELPAAGVRFAWLSFVPVDVSIPLLLTASKLARECFVRARGAGLSGPLTVLPICADFEEGPLSFTRRLATNAEPGGARLITLLGNTFGNLRQEEAFMRQRLWQLARPGDLVWIEVALKLPQIEQDPLFAMTRPGREETAAEANRRILLEGPYRRWEAALGRRPGELGVRISLRQDDETSRVPGSVNFCHDLLIRDDRRVCTMLYSRRYDLDGLTGWLERLGFSCERVSRVEDSLGRTRVAHLLLRRHP